MENNIPEFTKYIEILSKTLKTSPHYSVLNPYDKIKYKFDITLQLRNVFRYP